MFGYRIDNNRIKPLYATQPDWQRAGSHSAQGTKSHSYTAAIRTRAAHRAIRGALYHSVIPLHSRHCVIAHFGHSIITPNSRPRPFRLVIRSRRVVQLRYAAAAVRTRLMWAHLPPTKTRSFVLTSARRHRVSKPRAGLQRRSVGKGSARRACTDAVCGGAQSCSRLITG